MTEAKGTPSFPGIRFWAGNDDQLEVIKKIEGVDKIEMVDDHYMIYVTVHPAVVEARLIKSLDFMEAFSWNRN